MTFEELQADDEMVKSWRETVVKDETVKAVLGAMDESSPINSTIPEIDKEPAEAKYWFFRGYAFYHKRLQDLAKYSSKPKVLRTRYAEEQ